MKKKKKYLLEFWLFSGISKTENGARWEANKLDFIIALRDNLSNDYVTAAPYYERTDRKTLWQREDKSYTFWVSIAKSFR